MQSTANQVPQPANEFTQPVLDFIRSQNDDEDFVELVELYVSEMPERTAELRKLFKLGDIDALKTRAHQIKGSATGYGFPQLTNLAAGLESACKAGRPDQIADELMEMLSFMSRIRN